VLAGEFHPIDACLFVEYKQALELRDCRSREC